MNLIDILAKLKGLGTAKAIEGMARFGITPDRTFGVSMPNLRKIGKEIGVDHDLARQLWEAGYRETRILASIIDDPLLVTEGQADAWIKDFDYWEICDQCCMNLFWRLPFADKKAIEWSKRENEFEKRAGFALMACFGWKDKTADNERFKKFYPAMIRESNDERTLVKKAISWALRNIGKKNPELNREAIEIGEEVQKLDSSAAKWIASDVLRELTSEKIQERLKKKL
ncbi:MAG: DNA alkylation repair protein [Candidatus Thermoplasmatota archaeon]|jgi:3-methyladenine DNA glycosylase AlkD|nr:DNA alkylation repair protein [Candidatus Thermoplasmatota archaeon]MDP7266039.1 DNA alkylation repair protein [Candidatus Thermoplasmatota archaeon]